MPSGAGVTLLTAVCVPTPPLRLPDEITVQSIVASSKTRSRRLHFGWQRGNRLCNAFVFQASAQLSDADISLPHRHCRDFAARQLPVFDRCVFDRNGISRLLLYSTAVFF